MEATTAAVGAPVARGRARGRRTKALGALFAGAALVLVTACGGGDSGGSGDGKGGGSDKADNAPSQAVVTISPKDGAGDVATDGALKVSAEQGKLTEVVVEDGKGNEVEGKIAGDGANWTPVRHLAASTKYRVHAVAKDSSGRESAKEATFTTLSPENTFVGIFTPEDGSKVGVGMPFSVHFTRGITDPAAVEKAIEIKTEPEVPVEGHWFGNDRLDFRPEKYWEAGTKVSVKLNLDGVEGRPGVYGEQVKTVNFEIGRSQVSVVDAKTHKMKVERDGKLIRTIPITAGAPATTTYNGQMVISEKLKVTRMNGDTVGFGGEYDIKDVPHAMRLSTSGTFIHGNYWAPNAPGNENVSHGCVGLKDVRGAGDKKQPAAWFFDNSLLGDVVVVKNSKDKQIQPDNGLNGWNMSWEKWKA
ncbi:Ig-like domain-containing protein [Streptomyces physcomitrii]|uniref:Lipoprotein n=1 Tax=Streptomyces albus (strain ATCC 21838 / DSM 41398 / FERM P-419 / JCM 4703 / NBRC 107858) TaxID=1081613 RepID=A0A0B5EIU7_STRA4|nr:lipoprotein [Streptomyces albus]AOU76508.1 lipoprotein [Streptomyces albus]AYN32292.1 lipoprotein [Streptomyces albus]